MKKRITTLNEIYDMFARLGMGNVTNPDSSYLCESAEDEMLNTIEQLNQQLQVGKIELIGGDTNVNESVNEVNPFAQKQKNLERSYKTSKPQVDAAKVDDESMMKHLEKITTNYGAKTHKTEGSLKNDKYWQYSLTLVPKLPIPGLGILSCTGAANCKPTCLFYTGIQADKNAQQSAQERLNDLIYDHNKFMSYLKSDLHQMLDVAKRYINSNQLQGVMCRLNNMSDIPITYFSDIVGEDGNEDFGENITEMFPEIQFIDYTKVYTNGRGTSKFRTGDKNAMNAVDRARINSYDALQDIGGGNMDIYLNGWNGRKYNNYYCIYSFDGETHTSNFEDCKELLEKGYPIAVIFDTQNGRFPIPKTVDFGDKAYPVVIGDFSDARHLDRSRNGLGNGGYIVALSYKLISGFVPGVNVSRINKEDKPNAINLGQYYVDKGALTKMDVEAIKGNEKLLDVRKKYWPIITKAMKEQGVELYDYWYTKSGTPHPEPEAYSYYDKEKNKWVNTRYDKSLS